jgi:hypothetical protein
VGALTPADGSHQHEDCSKEALLQSLVLHGSDRRTRGQVRLRAKSMWKRAKIKAMVWRGHG